MNGGEIFVPKIPSMNIMDLAKAVAPECEIDIVGIRPGEKLHEAMIMEDDARHTKEFNDYYVIQPEFPWWTNCNKNEGTSLPDGFKYTSDSNEIWLTIEQLRVLAEDI
jgi:UDP-N-acetylglucosamine 4,6-dehydratase